MQDFEKLGAFYLGRQVDAGNGPAGELLLYDANDLTTHGVIIGMTGSGKTGLGISLIEEAAIDHVPVIAIDPKGDLGNLLLTFPGLRPEDFAPWVDARAAQTAGRTVAEYAGDQAQLWRQGLADWGQAPERIAKLKAAADFAIYTPGSTAGRPIAALRSLDVPQVGPDGDADLYRQHVQAVATSLLTLAGIEADPVTSRAHILIATVLDRNWRDGRSLDLAALIGLIQQPGVERVGVMDLDSFYPPKERFALAMRLNNLIASPGFEAWTQGEALDADTLLYTPAGKPRVAVVSIAHLGEAERMFFVTMLLNEIVAWMRTRPGTGSLRAILYIDEVAGYLPPVSAPPSKAPLLTLLKQARAYGLGVVLATQNPVDLDYKALSNAGTWFLGRLQTAQDRQRVRDGLVGATAGAGLDAGDIDGLLAGLGKRRFLLHNVHESKPVVFETRWAMSYLRGPLTRDDLRQLSGSGTPAAEAVQPSAHAARTAPAGSPSLAGKRPLLPPDLPVGFVEAERLPGRDELLVYQPRLLGAARVHYINARHGVDLRREPVFALEADGGAPAWDAAEELPADTGALTRDPEPDAVFGELPSDWQNTAMLKRWEKEFRAWLRNDRPLVLYRSAELKETSLVDETEAAFRIRLQQQGRELRDRQAGALRQKYAARFRTLQDRLRRAEQAVEREQQQASTSKMDTVVSMGSTLLGGLFGRKTSAAKIGSAIRKAGNLQKQAGDVQRATETVASVRSAIGELEAEVEDAVAALRSNYDAQTETLEEIAVRPKATDVVLQFFGVAWLPFIEDAAGNIRPAWVAGRDRRG